MATLDPDTFEEEQPQRWYLLEGQAEMEALSDAVLVAVGVWLPVHKAFLAYQSGVLRGLFAECSGERVGSKRKTRSSSKAADEVRCAVSAARALLVACRAGAAPAALPACRPTCLVLSSAGCRAAGAGGAAARLQPV